MNYNLTRHELGTRIVVEHVSRISLMLTMLSLYCVIIVSLNCWTVFIVIIKALPQILLVNSFILDSIRKFIHIGKGSFLFISRTVRSERLIFSAWRVLACLLVCGQLFQLLTPGGSPGSDFKYQHQMAH